MVLGVGAVLIRKTNKILAIILLYVIIILLYVLKIPPKHLCTNLENFKSTMLCRRLKVTFTLLIETHDLNPFDVFRRLSLK